MVGGPNSHISPKRTLILSNNSLSFVILIASTTYFIHFKNVLDGLTGHCSAKTSSIYYGKLNRIIWLLKCCFQTSSNIEKATIET